MRVALPTEQQVADLHEQLLASLGGPLRSRVGTSIGAVLGRIQMNLAYRPENTPAQQIELANLIIDLADGKPTKRDLWRNTSRCWRKMPNSR